MVWFLLMCSQTVFGDFQCNNPVIVPSRDACVEISNTYEKMAKTARIKLVTRCRMFRVEE